ncbi:MAG: S8 family serine peptidase [candidate division KSB1 bacterium]|nr:S8 family serine peptidase [candidate division KSB1 bacterium]
MPYSFRIFLAVFLPVLVVGAVGKMDPRLTRLAATPEVGSAYSDILAKSAGEEQVRVVLTFRGGEELLRKEGVKFICRRGDMAVADLPLSALQRVAELPNVVYVEAPHPDRAALDKSTVAVNAVKARNQRGVTGRGVIVGIIDSGIDWTHYDFRKPDGTTRIKAMLDLSRSGAVYGGEAYDERQINEALEGRRTIAMRDVSGHGTHVAAIAAADGAVGEGLGEYAGVAPEADLVIVKATRDEAGREFRPTDQIIGLTFIDSVAQVLGKPYVANLSLGGHSGAHDGTSPVERFIDNLVGRGKVVVTVAGNDGNNSVHARAVLRSSSEPQTISLRVENYRAENGAENDIIALDGWYDGSQKIGVTVVSPSGREYGPVLPGNVLEKKTTEGTVYIWNGFYEDGENYRAGANPLNGDREFYIQIYDGTAVSPPADGLWKFVFTGSGGTIDLWLVNATMEVSFETGDFAEGKLTIPGTSRSAITVASFVTKRSWIDLDGNSLTYDVDNTVREGQLSSFSSPGPVRKGGYVKPDIAAPGQIIVGAYSVDAPPNGRYSIFNSGSTRYPNAYVNKDGKHALSSGTSMAAPHVAGAAALLLQQDATLTAQQIKEMMTGTARVDAFVGATPNIRWGWGKLDVLEALAAEPPDEEGSLLALLPPQPNPFLNRTAVSFQVPVSSGQAAVELDVYDALGRRVRKLVRGASPAGRQTVYWDGLDDGGRAVAGGIYFVRLKINRWSVVQKLVFCGVN